MFSIGVNDFARFAIQDLQTNTFPHLLMVSDGFKGKTLDHFKELFNCHNSPLISAYTPGEQELPADYRFPYCGGKLRYDLEFGLSISPDFVKFNRTSYAAAHLGCLLGFKRVVLLGVDHNDSYQKGDSLRATHAFEYMREWMLQQDCQLIQAGNKSGFASVPYIGLENILSTVEVHA